MDNPIVTILNAIGLDGVQAAVLAAGMVIISIALTFRGPVLGKKVIRQVG